MAEIAMTRRRGVLAPRFLPACGLWLLLAGCQHTAMGVSMSWELIGPGGEPAAVVRCAELAEDSRGSNVLLEVLFVRNAADVALYRRPAPIAETIGPSVPAGPAPLRGPFGQCLAWRGEGTFRWIGVEGTVRLQPVGTRGRAPFFDPFVVGKTRLHLGQVLATEMSEGTWLDFFFEAEGMPSDPDLRRLATLFESKFPAIGFGFGFHSEGRFDRLGGPMLFLFRGKLSENTRHVEAYCLVRRENLKCSDRWRPR